MNNKLIIITLIQQEQDCLLRYAISLTKNIDDAQDLLQQTYLKTLENHEKLSNLSNIKGWILCIMRNTFINDYNKKIKETKHLYNYRNHIGNLTDNTTELSLNLQAYSLFMSRLDPKLQQAFSLFIAGYQYEEISQIQNCPLGTIKNRIYRARQKLKYYLTQHS